jgi:DNA-binding IclR family transcriptional regulator
MLEHESPIGIHEISKKLQLYPSTVHRILNTLKLRGYVEKDLITEKYRLGPKMVKFAMARLDQTDLTREAIPYLKELVYQCNETVHLGVFEDGEVLYIATEEPPQTIRMVSKVGTRAPAHCTALGKVLLSVLPQRERKKILEAKGLRRFTEHTIIDKQSLRRELRRVKDQGFALDREEYERDVRCVATPIKDHRGRVIAAISISGPAFRVGEDKRDFLVKALTKVSMRISEQLGYRGGSGTSERRS